MGCRARGEPRGATDRAQGDDECKGARFRGFDGQTAPHGRGKAAQAAEGIANQVNAIEDDFIAMDDDELRGQTADFKSRYERGETLEALLPVELVPGLTPEQTTVRKLREMRLAEEIPGRSVTRVWPSSTTGTNRFRVPS